MMRKWLLLLTMIASPALAQDERDFCADRPGLGTPTCTTAPGEAMVEVGLLDWTIDRTSASRTSTLIAGDALVRVGIAERAEIQVGWTSFGNVRQRDRLIGAIDQASGVGDVTVAVRRNIASPDGSGLSIAVMPYATLPTGGSAIGAGDWGAGVVIPVTFDLGAGLSLGLTPEIDAAVDSDGSGRHLAYSSVVGLGIDLSDTLSATTEIQLLRDRDPDVRSTQALAGLSLGWQASKVTQLDVGANFGLNEASSDIEMYVGIARRF